MRPISRNLPLGAELQDGGAHFRVWAPATTQVAVELCAAHGSATTVPLTPEANGYFSGQVAGIGAGARYRLRVDGGAFPDPASRFQPEGPHGPSQVVDPRFAWTDAEWRGRPVRELVIYELHLGTFTAAGTWRAAMERLPELAQLGVTMIEVMPIADFPGEFGWGYDGVNLFAPSRLYGLPTDAKAFVNRAHELGLAVILDVVYNHFGPDGNYLAQFSRDFVSRAYANEWGDALNFDGESAAGVREFFCTNAAYWIGEFHFDGLRLDATQQIYDRSPTHILAEIAQAARAAAPRREIYLVAENETQEARLVRAPVRQGYGLSAIWNDDFHHTAIVAATGKAEAYYSGFRGAAQEFVSVAKHGFLYQGQWYGWQKKRRGAPALDLPNHAFVNFLENHDQVSNSLHGRRLHELTCPGRFRALTALLLLGRATPLLFQGQEFSSTAPFVYFADHGRELAEAVRQGRGKFIAQFRSAEAADTTRWLSDPGARKTWKRCRLNWGEREQHDAVWRMHAELLRVRRATRAIFEPERVDGAVLGTRAFVLRYFSASDGDRLLVVNLGADLRLEPASEPLLAPLENCGWDVQWSSEAPEWGGGGTAPLETTAGWFVPGEAAVLLQPEEARELPSVRLSEKD
ncbi:MAG: malto-oligosyltrehalose trehalohydrolase [Opitutus sp.]|nr:malto-oligosyltrehalose trehalohydrolase [Opitutus sp.]